jgi:thiamine thiazole synthase
LARKAIEAGAKVLLGWHVEDLIFREVNDEKEVVGVVALWSPIEISKLHVDPIFFKSKAVIDATGHGAEVLKIAQEKLGVCLGVDRETGAWAERGEELVVKETGRVMKGLYAAGMSVASWKKLPRMGPAISGMLLSGLKIAKVVKGDLKS